jgi:hypothetical protein
MPCTTECHKAHGRQAHCGNCHRSFTAVGTFDLHRRGGECWMPKIGGMTEKNGVWGNWGSTNGKKWWVK